MKVLGISPLDKDSTVTLVEDGVITYAAAEERFTRVKLQDGFPWQALESALETHRHAAPSEIDTRRLSVPDLATRRRGCSSGTSRTSASSSTRREAGATADELIARRAARVPDRDAADPRPRRSERADGEGPAQDLAYRVLASEGVVSRNVAKRGSEQWGRDASAFHQQVAQELERRSTELGAARQAEARRASPEPRGQRVSTRAASTRR